MFTIYRKEDGKAVGCDKEQLKDMMATDQYVRTQAELEPVEEAPEKEAPAKKSVSPKK